MRPQSSTFQHSLRTVLTSSSAITRCLSGHEPRHLRDVGDGEAAVAAILVENALEAPDLLLIKRAARVDDPWSGQMALPGGRREAADRDLIATASRETNEETGIVLSVDNLIGQLDDIRPLGPGLPRLVVRPFVFLLESHPTVVANEEVDLYLWVRLSDLPGRASRALVPVEEREIDVPAFLIGPHVVWGLTERILNSFIELCV